MDMASWTAVTDPATSCSGPGMMFQQSPQQNYDMNSNTNPNIFGIQAIGMAMDINQPTMGMFSGKGAGHQLIEGETYQNNGQWEGIYNMGASTMTSGPAIVSSTSQTNIEVSAESQQQHMLFDQQSHAQQVYAHQLYAQQVYQQQIQQQQQLQMNTSTQFCGAAEPEQQYQDYFAQPHSTIKVTLNDESSDKKQKSGIVNRWFKDKKSGWIRGDDGRNLFVHYSDVHGNRQELQTGERVTYFVGWNHKVSKEKAEKVKPLVANPSPPVQITMMPLEGTVLRWHDDKSFGFIKYDIGSVFVHHSDLIDAEKLEAGQRVKFEIIVNAACNKHKAVRVSIIDDNNWNENGGWDNVCNNGNDYEYENDCYANDDWENVDCGNNGYENYGDKANAKLCDENNCFEQALETSAEIPQEEASIELVVNDLSKMAVNESTT